MGVVKRLLAQDWPEPDDEPSERPLPPDEMELVCDWLSAEDWGVDR